MPPLPSTSGTSRLGAPPPYSELDPSSNHGHVVVNLAQNMLEQISHLPGSYQKQVIERMITIYNANTVDKNDRVLLSHIQEFGRHYPKLDQLINQLSFVSASQLGFFAFACGHYSLYCDVYQEAKTDEHLKKMFFEKYFLAEGSDQGIAGLQLFTECKILVECPAQRLNRVMDENNDVELIEGSQIRSPTPGFDFQTVSREVASKLSSRDVLSLSLGLKLSNEVDGLLAHAPRDGRSGILILLNEFARHGGRDSALPEILDKNLRRRDLREALEKALSQRRKMAPVQCSDQPPKKSKR